MKRKTAAALTALLLAGCTGNGLKVKETPEGNQSVANIDEAGSVHVAVLAVTPWNEIKAKLRPDLKIDPKDLRNQAIPVTFAMLDKYLDILRLQASLAPVTLKTTSTLTNTSETGKDDVSKNQSTTTRAPGEARATPGAAALAAGSAPALAASGASGINSSLTARAMASFVQDVQALNAEVDSAARRTGYEPYLMRVQISVMPRRRHLGYDVYSNLSFFGYRGAFDANTGAAGTRTANAGMPFIVPLLSTDSIETAQRSQSIEALRDVGLALDLVKGFGSVGASVSSQKDRQQALQGLDVNSVLTMGRLSDNTLRVRFGAAYDPGGGFTAHPRTNTISLLVFFPKDAQQTRLVSRSAWTHVLDGTVLERSAERYGERLKPISEQWSRLGLTTERLREIDELPLEGNYKGFQEEMDKTLRDHCAAKLQGNKLPAGCEQSGRNVVHELHAAGREGERERTYAYVWSHLLSLLPGSRFSTTVVDLPKLDTQCPPAAQLAAYVENDKGLTVALGGGNDLAIADLKAAVHWAYLAPAPRPAAPAALGTAPMSIGVMGTAKRVASVKPMDAAKPAAAEPVRSVLTGYAGALMASGIDLSADRKAVNLAFASEKMTPAAWTQGTELTPVAVELAGCNRNPNPIGNMLAGPTGLGQPTPVFSPAGQFYLLSARVPKPEKADAKAKGPQVALDVGTTNLLLNRENGSSAFTTVTVDLGEKPETGFALTVVGGVIKTAAPADRVVRRADGAYEVKASGPVDLTFVNLVANQTLDLELRSIDEKGKLGAAAKKLTFTARATKT